MSERTRSATPATQCGVAGPHGEQPDRHLPWHQQWVAAHEAVPLHGCLDLPVRSPGTGQNVWRRAHIPSTTLKPSIAGPGVR